MGQGFKREFVPDNNNVKLYASRYRQYERLGECIEHHGDANKVAEAGTRRVLSI